MTMPEFNLLDEPWIKVIRPDCTEEEVSLTQALLRAHEFKDLCGEMATQDVAVLRLLLAVLHTVWSRVDTDGAKSPLESAEDAEERWETLWNLGRFPAQPILDYLAQWHERFWLFHDQRPFGQTPAAAGGTEYGASKLNGELSESSNKLRLFTTRRGTGKDSLSYAEAARWVLNLNGYDDTSSKPKGKNLPSPGAGWLGKLGLITAKGKNLFETLLLNLVLLPELPEEHPAWEDKVLRSGERTEIAQPDNLAQLYTLQSRRILLQRENGRVTSYGLLGGDFFPRENALIEQMTAWRSVENKKTGKTDFLPKRHDAGRQMWREFETLFTAEQGKRRPGVVDWAEKLRQSGMIARKEKIRFEIASVHYGDKDFFVNDSFRDALTFHADLLSSVGAGWRVRIQEEINRCEQLAWCAGKLEDDLAKAGGKDDGSGQKEDVRAKMYDRLDLPFRKWLYEIDPKVVGTEMEAHVDSWHDTACKAARQLGYELVSAAGEKAFFGRYLQEKQQGSVHYSSAEAYERFVGMVKKITSREGMKWQKK